MKKVFLILLLVINSNAFSLEKTINIYNSIETKPFLVSEEKKIGYVYEITELLNQELKNKYKFNAINVSRNRIDSIINNPDFNDLLFFMNPKWVNDEKMKKFHWPISLFEEKNLIVSLKEKPFDYTNPRSLIGKNIGTQIGHQYPELNEYFKSQLITREDTINEEANLKRLLNKKIDIILISSSILNTLLSENQSTERELYISKNVRSKAFRYIMCSKNNMELSTELQKLNKSKTFRDKINKIFSKLKI